MRKRLRWLPRLRRGRPVRRSTILRGVTVNDIDAPGPVEQRVARVLATDFLSPLTAGFLFTDFTQLFSLVAFPFLDHRFLEYTLENAADSALKGVDQTNLLKARLNRTGRRTTDVPALLLNMTDVGSGKRVVISPFDMIRLTPRTGTSAILQT